MIITIVLTFIVSYLFFLYSVKKGNKVLLNTVHNDKPYLKVMLVSCLASILVCVLSLIVNNFLEPTFDLVTFVLLAIIFTASFVRQGGSVKDATLFEFVFKIRSK